MLHFIRLMYSLDIRKLATHVYSMFLSLRKTAIILKVSHSSVSRWLKNVNKKQYHRKPSLSTEHVVCTIKSALIADPFVSTRKIVSIVKDVCNVDVSKELVRTAINKIGYTRKKAKFLVHLNVSKNKHKFSKNDENIFLPKVDRSSLLTKHLLVEIVKRVKVTLLEGKRCR